ncbi:hypothetical protein HK105_200738 [Polyrhizophydium stewartii]|uniref:WD repeat-containing protein 65 n=1 Tax=Polyrhizophydium stewartii TaxID=2732419 RepID=A0ABR4NJW2_9FUNG
MSIAAVTHKHVFGLKGDVANNITYLDEQTIIYPAGSNAILYNTENKTQKFIPTLERSEGMTVMAIGGVKRFLAIAERGEKPTCVIYDLHSLRRRKMLTLPDIESKARLGELQMSASHRHSKFLVTQTGAPDWTLHYWSWEKSKTFASVRTVNTPEKIAGQPAAAMLVTATSSQGASKENKEHLLGSIVYQVSINPTDSTQICCIGNGIFKLFRYQEGILKAVGTQKYDYKNFTAHTWTSDDRVIVGTEDSKIFVFESNGELKSEILHTHGTSQIPRSIHCIASFSKGFVVGCSGGMAALYERSEELATGGIAAAAAQISSGAAGGPGGQQGIARDLYRKSREYTLQDDAAKITNMAVSPSEDTLLCTTETCQIFSMSLANAEVKGEEAKFDPFAQPFHHGMITGMDTCIRKPLIVTCSSDKSIRVWNYLETSSELVKYFAEEAFSVAIHPSGLYILVGFSDKLRLMNLLIDDIRPFREFTIRGCRECRFSNGGQYFAAVHGNTIQIYSTWNFDNLGNLKGHNGKVRSIFWTADDSKIISAGVDGAIYDWSLRDLSGHAGFGIKREGESILKSCSYSCACATPDGKTIFAEIIDSQIVRELEADCVLTQVLLSHSGRMMFVGTASGAIRSMKFPLGSEPGEFQEHQGHSMAISKMRVSYDDQYLFSASEDGCLFIFRITDRDGRGMKRERDIVYADEILVTKSDLEEKNSMMAELKTRVEELKMENEYQLRLKDMNFNEKIKEVTEKFMQEIEALKITSTVLRTDKEKEETRHEEEMAEEKDRHSKELMELEMAHNAKLMAEYEKYQELQVKTAELQEQWEKQMLEMQSAKDQALEDLTRHFEVRLKEKQAEIDRLQEEMKRQLLEFEETTKETEQDADSEVLELKHRYERKLKEEREIVLRLKGENGIMRKKFNTLQGEIDAHKGEIAKMYNEEKKLHSVIKSLEKDIAGLKKEIQERDETIQDKEKRIYDLKKKNQELEKFKFVLDYKIKELKKQIEPREQDIQGMTQQIKEMDVELEHYHRANSDLDLTIADLKLKLKAAEKEVARERAKVNSGVALIRRFKVDLSETMQYIQEPKLLKTHLKKLYQKYCKESARDEDSMEVDIQQEYSRQREYLERTVASLRRKVSKDQMLHRSDNVRIMQENVTLIKEINQLRRDITGVKQKEHTAEMALKNLPPRSPSTVVPGEVTPGPMAATAPSEAVTATTR